MAELTLTRAVTRAECVWLDRDYAEGERVYRYTGHTYGCVSPEGIACTEGPEELPFFELPRDALEPVSHD